MVTLLELFIEFLKIGAIMFGGGYGGVSLYYKELVELKGWISDQEFVEILGIAESTPGPIAINSATWVGYKLGGIPGSILATLGVITVPYLVIMSIVMSLYPYMEHPLVKTAFRGINAAVVALILYALINVGRAVLLEKNTGMISYVSLAIFIVAFIILYVLRQHPVVSIIVSAGLSLALKLLFGV
ncbi:MAG: chromate transporter [Thermosphaera aggregans]|jgi:chromate transporter|uniref:chromate transporter n=1 Tax=Thermosphaera aggregans TaxID=54254 RepID=UPI003C094307